VNPYLPPETGPTRETNAAVASLESPPVPATFGIRAGARIVDLVVGVVVGFIGGGVGGAIVGLAAPERVHDLSKLTVASFLLSTLGSLAYHTISECVAGASVGKLVCGLRVVSQNGFGRPTVLGAFIRTLGYYIDSLFFGLVGYSVMSKSELQQRLGDKWGKTVVVKSASLRAGVLPGPVVGLMTALLAWCALAFASTVVKVL
jgi:uncharacterized RDD family membrane protein YckC